MIYSVWVNLFYDLEEWDYFSIENVVADKPLSYDKVLEIALAEAIKDVEDVYGISDEHLDYSKASIISVVSKDSFLNE